MLIIPTAFAPVLECPRISSAGNNKEKKISRPYRSLTSDNTKINEFKYQVQLKKVNFPRKYTYEQKEILIRN